MASVVRLGLPCRLQEASGLTLRGELTERLDHTGEETVNTLVGALSLLAVNRTFERRMHP